MIIWSQWKKVAWSDECFWLSCNQRWHHDALWGKREAGGGTVMLHAVFFWETLNVTVTPT